MSNARDAAFGAAHDLLGDAVEAPDSEQEQASGTDDTAAAEEPQETEQTDEFNLDPEVPDDIRALVDEPDFEAEAEEEIAASVEEEWDEDGQDEYVDPRLAEERKKRVAAEKKAAHYEQLRVKAERTKWEDEAAKFYPLADVKKIDATSRRAFLRAAKSRHEETKPFVLRGIESHKQDLQAEFDAKYAEAKAELERAWGRPLAGSSQVPERVPGQKADIDAAWKRSPAAGVRAMLDQEAA